AHLRFELSSFLAEEGGETSDQSEVRGPHDVEMSDVLVEEEDREEVEEHARRRDPQSRLERLAAARGEDGEAEEHVGRASRSFGDERDGGREQHVENLAEGLKMTRYGAAVDEIQHGRAVREMETEDCERDRIDRERSADHRIDVH